MRDYSKYVTIAPCSQTPRFHIGRGLCDFILAWLRDFFFISERPEGRNRILSGRPPQLSNLAGYHAPYIPNGKEDEQ